METKEVAYCKDILHNLGRYEQVKLIKSSNLNNMERNVIYNRFVVGKSTKETSEEMSISVDALNKMQKRSLLKLYSYLTHKVQVIYI